MTSPHAFLAPIYLPGQEPLPPGTTADEREAYYQALKWQRIIGYVPESCPFKLVLAGGMGFALGGFVSLMSATFAYEDPLTRASTQLAGAGTRAQTAFVFKEMGRNMWSSGRGFAKVGMLYSGFECCIEGYRAKNDMTNGISAGFMAGAVLARNSGPKAMVGGGLAFAAFSYGIELYMRKAPAEEI